MQSPFSCIPSILTGIEKTISPARLGRYMPAAGRDKQFALRLYLWNARLCEEFYLPAQLAEVSFRNALNAGLIARFGASWHRHSGFVSGLPDRLRHQLSHTVTSEGAQHGAGMTVDHIVSGMSLGFWLHLVSSRPRRVVWHGQLLSLFPHLPPGTSEQAIYDSVDRLRRFRNRVAHHGAIFDKKPITEFRNIENIIGWISPETLWLVRQMSSPSRVINARPRC